MRKFKSLAITCLICISMALPVSAASLDSQLSALQADLNDTVEKTTKGLLGSRYTVGSIYITSANVDEEEVADMMGGEWIEINSTFLWATDGSHSYKVDEDGDGKDDNDGSTISPLHQINGRDGKPNYTLLVNMGSDGKGIGFWTGEASVYADEHDTISLSGTDATSDYTNPGSGMTVVDRDSSNQLEIIPPYTVVKMFERIG